MSKYGKQFWIDKLGASWTIRLKEILRSDYGTKLMDFLTVEYSMQKVNPSSLDKVFLPFKTCDWENVKIVIVTTEPHTFVGASGYGFGEPYASYLHSNKLSMIYEAVERAYYVPNKTFNFDFDFTLESWAKQGILLLNLSLSIRKQQPGSHEKPWNKFSSEVLNQLNENKTGLIFLLIGERPRKLSKFLNHKLHYIIEEKCPSEYEVLGEEFPEKVFLEIDKITENLYNTKINW